jgi:glutamyl-tRNA reductase
MRRRIVCLSQRARISSPRGRRIFVPRELLPAETRSLRGAPGVLEAVILSTCLRFEIYAALEEGAGIIGPIAEYLRAAHGVDPAAPGASISVFRDQDAVRHLFEVVCGLDSSIVGEKQIVAQVKEAYHAAHAAGCTGPVLNRLFQKCLNVSKRVRTRTGIDRGVCSVASLAVTLVQRRFGGLGGTRALVLGAGQMGKLAALNLAAHGCGAICFAARSEENARIVARQCGAACIPFSSVPEALGETDILLAATGAPHQVVGYAMIEEAMRRRGGRALCIVDLADPPDVDPRAASIGGVTLFTLRCVDALAEAPKQARLAAMRNARAMIEESIGEFTRARDGAARPAACAV